MNPLAARLRELERATLARPTAPPMIPADVLTEPAAGELWARLAPQMPEASGPEDFVCRLIADPIAADLADALARRIAELKQTDTAGDAGNRKE